MLVGFLIKSNIFDFGRIFVLIKDFWLFDSNKKNKKSKIFDISSLRPSDSIKNVWILLMYKNVLDFVNLPEIRNSEPRLWWNLLKYKIGSPGRNPVGSISGLVQKHINKLSLDDSNL